MPSMVESTDTVDAVEGWNRTDLGRGVMSGIGVSFLRGGVTFLGGVGIALVGVAISCLVSVEMQLDIVFDEFSDLTEDLDLTRIPELIDSFLSLTLESSESLRSWSTEEVAF